MLLATSRDFNQSLLDYFNLADLQLILMLMCECLNFIISGLHCWAVKLEAILIKEVKLSDRHFVGITRYNLWSYGAKM